MSTRIKLKSSVIKDKIPNAGDIVIGEVCVGAHEDSPMLLFKDNADNIIKIEPGSGVAPSPTPPDAPDPGDLWYDTGNNTLNYWNGTSWETITGDTDSLWKEDGTAVTPKATGADLKIEGGITAAGSINAGSAFNAGDGIQAFPGGSIYIRQDGAGSANNLITVLNGGSGTDNQVFRVNGDGSVITTGRVDSTSSSYTFIGRRDSDNTATFAVNSTGYVNVGPVSGNNSNIILDGTSGSITAAGDFFLDYDSVGKQKGFRVIDNGGYTFAILYGDGSNNDAFAIYDGASSTYPLRISYDGSITAAGSVASNTSGFDITLGQPSNGVVAYSKSTTESNILFYGLSDVGGTAVPKVKLNADGSIFAAGTVNASGHTVAGGLQANGGVNLSSGKCWIRQDGGNDVYRVYQGGNSSSNITFAVTGTGSITAAGAVTAGSSVDGRYGVVAISNADGSGDKAAVLAGNQNASGRVFCGQNAGVTTSEIFADGSITAAGDIDSGGNAIGGNETGVNLRALGNISIAQEDYNGGPTNVLNVYKTGNSSPNFILKNDGSITAAGPIKVTPDLPDGDTGYRVEYTDPANEITYIGVRSSSTNYAFGHYDGSKYTSTIGMDGSASFAGQVDALSLNSTSDITLKKDITPIENAVSKLSSVNGVGFAWKKNDERTYGVIAQDVEKEFPELVSTKDFKSVNYNGLVGVLIEAVKELKAEIEELKKR